MYNWYCIDKVYTIPLFLCYYSIKELLSLTAMVMKKSEDNSNTLVIGRFVMTCCADDMSVFGFICDFDSETDLDLDDWIFVNAIVEKEYAEK